jgi:hypothetical protein
LPATHVRERYAPGASMLRLGLAWDDAPKMEINAAFASTE